MVKNDTKNPGTRMLADGIYVSNNTRETGLNNNDLIIGGTGSGKTGGYIFQMLMNPQGSMILSDTKGLLCRMFKGYLESKGYVVKVMDFVRPEKSIPYNPLKYIRMDADGYPMERDIKKIASLIMPMLDRNDPFWEKAAIRYVSMLIGYVMEALPEEERTMETVCKIHREFLYGAGREMMEEWAFSYPDSFAVKKYKEIRDSKDAEKMWRSIIEFANEALDPFGYKEFAPIFGNAEDCNLLQTGKEKTVLFINSSDSDKSFQILGTLFFAQALQCLLENADSNPDGRLDVPVRLILDDFAAGPRLDDFERLISIIRSREISVSVIIQNISQLEERYSPATAKTIINNCDHILFLSGHDDCTADYFAKFLDRRVSTVLAKARKDSLLITDGETPRFVKKIEPYPAGDIEIINRFAGGNSDSGVSLL